MIIYTPPADTGLDILYQDDYLLAINKPSGLLSVPGKDPQNHDSLALRVQARFADALVVHRLDMSTSGIMLFALGKQMHRELSILFQDRKMDKAYTAIVDGIVEPLTGSIDLPLITDWPNRPKQKVDYDTGKPSLTHYRVLELQPEQNMTRVELVPYTGRSHQLRVHMQSLGHAILGDRLYASPMVQARAQRLLLHATRLSFIHPVNQQLLEVSSLPPF